MNARTVQRRDDMQRAIDQELDRLLAALDAPAADLPGLAPRPSAEQLGAALARNANRLSEARAAVYASSWHRDEVMKVLGVTTQQISNLLKEQKLVALGGVDGQMFPSWQFDLDGAEVRVEGIADLVGDFPGGVVSLSLWALAPNPKLHGRTPAQALRDGDREAVLAAVEATNNL